MSAVGIRGIMRHVCQMGRARKLTHISGARIVLHSILFKLEVIRFQRVALANALYAVAIQCAGLLALHRKASLSIPKKKRKTRTAPLRQQ